MKLFVLLSRVPYPLEKGDKLRAYHQLRFLSRHHEVYLYCLNDNKIHPDALPELEKFCKAVKVFRLTKRGILWNLFRALIKGLPLSVGYFYSAKIRKEIAGELAGLQPDHLYCQLIRTAEYLKDSSIPKTLDYQDVFSKGAARRVAVAPWYMKPLFRIEYRRLQRYEKQAFDWFDHKTIISKPDRDLIPHPCRDEIRIIINGVDYDYFTPADQPRTYDLVFIGNMAYPPNINSAEFLVNQIVPLVRKQFPALKVLIAGASPHRRVRDLASANVTVMGWVKDIRECYASSRIFIAPMQIGTGLQNKLLEAMAMQLPCITSALANRALEAEENSEILVGQTPAEYSAHVSFLLKNPEKAREMALKGYEFVRSHYDWALSTARLEEIIASSASAAK